jgi:peptidoglycan/LPS O-acetylase OafA/YrhL
MSDVSESDSRLYWPQLDGLRFIAALMVFINHAGLYSGLPGYIRSWGWIGVDLFLVLSAFLLTRLLRAEAEKSAVNVRHYFIRRICRIWPLYLTFVSAMLLVAIAKGRDPGLSLFTWFSHVAFFNNFLTAVNGWSEALPHTVHLWTISLEEQYYLLVPFVAPFMLRLKGKNTARFAVATAIMFLWVARSVCVFLDMQHPFIWTLPLRADGLLMGTALGLGLFDFRMIRSRGGLCFAAGIGLLIAVTFMPAVRRVGWNQVPIYTLVDFGCTLLVIGSLNSRVVGAVLSMRWLRYLGKISFGIYVYHHLILHYARMLPRTLGITNRPLIFMIALTVTCLLAALSYELFEKRFLRLKRRYTVIQSRPV